MDQQSLSTLAPVWSDGPWAWLTEPLFTVGDLDFSAMSLLKLLVFCAIILWAGTMIRRVLVRTVFPRAHVDPTTGQALGATAYFGFVLLALMVGLQASGIDLSALTVLFGALGVGVGFGLQAIASNFISGLIILFEKPIRIGDRIQVGDLHGQVVRIKTRATEVVTNDGIAVIVPNSDFISQRVVNWSHSDNKIRVRVPVGVAYSSDIDRVREALLEAAASVEATLQDPPPRVRLRRFGDSSLDFELLAWTAELLQSRGEFVSRLNFAIHDTLRRLGIEIPFPQHDVHVQFPSATQGAPSQVHRPRT